MEKKPRIMYRSEGTDDVDIVCSTVEEAINCFRQDAEAILGANQGKFGNEDTLMEIALEQTMMTDEEVANVREM